MQIRLHNKQGPHRGSGLRSKRGLFQHHSERHGDDNHDDNAPGQQIECLFHAEFGEIGAPVDGDGLGPGNDQPPALGDQRIFILNPIGQKRVFTS